MNTGLMKIRVLNVRGLYGREKLLQGELKNISLPTTRKENNW